MSVCTIVSTDYYSLNISRNENESDVVAFKQKLRELIWNCYCGGVTEFYVNMEYGIPFWSAETICALKNYNDIHLHIVIPYENQTRDWHEDLRDRYYKVHESADNIEFASSDYNDDCYNEADEAMADESDIVLIFGEKSENFYIAEYAKKNEITVEYVSIDTLLGLKL